MGSVLVWVHRSNLRGDETVAGESEDQCCDSESHPNDTRRPVGTLFIRTADDATGTTSYLWCIAGTSSPFETSMRDTRGAILRAHRGVYREQAWPRHRARQVARRTLVSPPTM